MGGESVAIPEGTSIGSLVVGRPLESDGPHECYAGRQPGLEREVTLRVLRRDRLQDGSAVDRFQRCARLGSRVSHPNVVGVIDYFALRGDHYLVLEHVEGDDLASILERRAPLPRAICARIALEIARGLAELHARGVVHTGVRPERIWVSGWGEVKIDGLAEARDLSETSVPVAPSSPCTAPEVIRGERADERSDVYSLGMLLAYMRARAGPRGPGRISFGIERLSKRMCDPEAACRPSLARAVRKIERTAGITDPVKLRIELAAWLWQVRALSAEHALSPRRRAAHALMQPPDHAPVPATEAPVAAVAVASPATFMPDPDPERQPPLPPGSLRVPLEPRASTRSEPGVEETLASEGEPTESAPAGPPERRRRSVGAVAGLGGAALLVAAAFLLSRPVPSDLPPAVEAGAPSVARVVFAARPWAEVQVDDGPRFVTPRADPVLLAPGEHEVRFRHPRHAEVMQRFQVMAGEERVVLYDFETESPS